MVSFCVYEPESLRFSVLLWATQQPVSEARHTQISHLRETHTHQGNSLFVWGFFSPEYELR